MKNYFHSTLIVVNFEEKRRKNVQSDSFKILIKRFTNTNKQD